MTIVCFGGGNMGAALVHGWLDAEVTSPQNIVVVDPNSARHDALQALKQLGVTVVDRAPGAFSDAVIAVKPQHVVDVLDAIKSGGARRVVSVAAGVRLVSLTQSLDQEVSVIRAMPNTAALVRQSMTALCASPATPDVDRQWASALLGSVGKTVWVDEHAMDQFTAIVGSGPAYFLLLAELLADAATQLGLDRDATEALTRQLLVGVGQLVTIDSHSLGDLRTGVTSPGGTTEAGIEVLMQGQLDQLVASAVEAATKRSVQLGESS
jgi:pyrroline-5-carboxylate reductase